MKLIAPRLDVLPASQRYLWPLLSQIEPGFVLYGGTAIALYYGHRQSVDFDFFGVPPVDPTALKAKYDFLRAAEIIQAEPNSVSMLAETPHGVVKCSFFGGLEFGRVDTPMASEDNLVRLASPLDLAVQKLKFIWVRSEAKDYRDLDCLLQNGVNLAEAMGAAEAIYPGFPVAVSLRAMCYFEEGDVGTLAPDVKKRLVSAVQAFERPAAYQKVSAYLDMPADLVALLKERRQEIQLPPIPSVPAKGIRLLGEIDLRLPPELGGRREP